MKQADSEEVFSLLCAFLLWGLCLQEARESPQSVAWQPKPQQCPQDMKPTACAFVTIFPRVGETCFTELSPNPSVSVGGTSGHG